MDLFERIFSVADSTQSLDQFVSNNIDSIDDFHNTEYLSVKNFKDSIEKFILLKSNVIEKLDYSKPYNKAFISILLEFSERFNLTTFFVIIDDTGTDFFITYFFKIGIGTLFQR